MEIGSEFWDMELSVNNKFDLNNNQLFVLSGRTALDFIIQDIKSQKSLQTVYLPSYCCHTMIEPFISNDVKVSFYDVLMKETGGFHFCIDYNFPCDAVYLIQYFGFQDNGIESIAKEFNARGITVIEDVTHSLFTEKPYNIYADYIYGSLRKWTAVYTGGFVIRLNGDFKIKTPKETNKHYLKLRKHAGELKCDYIKKDIGSKETFLNLFNEAEDCLEKDYKNYSMDDISLERFKKININDLKLKRFENANTISKAIFNSNFMRPVFNNITHSDTPLFIPVIINFEIRDKFLKYLISNKIYCPVHWKITNFHIISDKALYIYNNILSLICDQRYNEHDMLYFAEKINNFRV